MPFQNNNFLFTIFSLLSIFNSTFSLSSHCFLSLQPMFSLSFFFKSPSFTLKSTAIKSSITDQASPIIDQAVSSFYIRHCWTVRRPHWSMVCHRSTSLSSFLIALSPCRSHNHRSRHVDLGFVLVVDVGLCRSLWLCFFFFFFFEVALMDVGLCWWWLSVLLRQWLLVAVVGQWWLCRCCCCCWRWWWGW